ncbi:MAG: DNA primase [Synergistaceae bacterium]|nr:DNA primase [Synergistaceae bacterium]
MANDDVREVKSRLDIAEVIGDYVVLRKSGQTYWGRCPFHNEKTPSFSVSPERQTFHCFGCGKGGDVYTFIMEIENLDFREALERLAERAGVKLQGYSGNSREKTLHRGNILKCALDYFIKSLHDPSGEAARAYLARRSIKIDEMRLFELGWAPPSWDSLYRHLSSMDFTEEQIIEGGLAAQGTRNAYDRFRGRVMFPIYSATDRLIGFGGRILDGDGAKYLNSPESALFNKRNNLYLMNKAKMQIREKGHVILVEGYMDAIRCHLAGYKNTVASLGTSLTESQARLIKRMTGLCYICYDSDSAGQEAALRGMYTLQKQGVSVKIVRLTGGKDPDEVLLQVDGPQVFESAVASAMPLPVYHAMLRKADMEMPEKSLAARNDLLEGLASLSPFDIAPYLSTISQQMGVFRHELERDIKARRATQSDAGSKRIPEDDFAETSDLNGKNSCLDPDDLECMLCSMLWGSDELRSQFSPEYVVPFIKDETLQNMISALLSGETPLQLEERWRQLGDRRSFELIARGNGIIVRDGIDTDKAESIAETIRRRCIEQRADTLKMKHKKGTATETEAQEYSILMGILKGGKSGHEKDKIN